MTLPAVTLAARSSAQFAGVEHVAQLTNRETAEERVSQEQNYSTAIGSLLQAFDSS